jgi:hypothetical protein
VPINLNRSNFSEKPLSVAIDQAIEAAAPPVENRRKYLGASAIGSECLREIQFDWMVDQSATPARTADIFDRGHWAEARTREHLSKAGFKFAPSAQLEFKSAGGLFRGHADGILTVGPGIPELRYPCLWECKCLKAQSWRAIERDGLVGFFEPYAAQVAIYQAYLEATDNPALFTVVNADTCERVHFLVPFDAELAQYWSDRAVAIIQATIAGELLPPFTDDREHWKCKACPHLQRCVHWSQKGKEEPKPAGASTSHELDIPEFLRRS